MAIVAGSWQFYTILAFTLFIVSLKFTVVVYLTKQMNNIKKEGENLGLSFINGIRILMLMFLISRIFYMVFDFYYTKFDLSLYAISPNYWFWKLGSFFSGLGIAYLIWVVEKTVLQNKYKGFFTYYVLIGCILILVWPVNDLDDFNMNSLFVPLTQLGILVVVIIFFNIFRKATGEMKKVAACMILAIGLYAFGSILVLSNIIDYANATYGGNMDVYFYMARAIIKSIGFVLFAYVARKFRI